MVVVDHKSYYGCRGRKRLPQLCFWPERNVGWMRIDGFEIETVIYRVRSFIIGGISHHVSAQLLFRIRLMHDSSTYPKITRMACLLMFPVWLKGLKQGFGLIFCFLLARPAHVECYQMCAKLCQEGNDQTTVQWCLSVGLYLGAPAVVLGARVMAVVFQLVVAVPCWLACGRDHGYPSIAARPHQT